MSSETISANLRRLRTAQALTQEQLARRASLSRAGYRKIELGESVPRADTLQALADALEVGIEELVRPVRKLRRIRFRSKKKMKRREQVIAEVARWLDDFNGLEVLLDDRRPYELGPYERDPTEAALQARADLGLGQNEPIRDICGLLESAGVKVLPIPLASDAFFGLSIAREDGGPAVAVNVWERISVERWIFSAAHELGHLVLHLDAYDASRAEEEDQQEKEANRFAAHFLMPDPAFWNEWGDTSGLPFYDRVLKVKRMFRVSYATILYRLSERYPGSGGRLWGRFRADHQRRTGKRLFKADEPEALPPDAFRDGYPEPFSGKEPERLLPSDFAEDRLSLLVRRAIEGEQITLSRGAEILGYSHDEMRQLAVSWAELGIQ